MDYFQSLQTQSAHNEPFSVNKWYHQRPLSAYLQALFSIAFIVLVNLLQLSSNYTRKA